MVISKKLLSSKVSEGVQLLSGGPTFSRGGGGPNAYFCRNIYNL